MNRGNRQERYPANSGTAHKYVSGSGRLPRKLIAMSVLLFLFSGTLWGEILFSVSSADLGSVPEDTRNTVEISLTNNGSSVVRITLTSTCDCLVVDTGSMDLAPGETRPIRFTYIADEGTGPFEKYVIIRSDDPSLPKGLFTLTGTVEPAAGESAGQEPGGARSGGGSSGAGIIGSSGTSGTAAGTGPAAAAIQADYYYDPGCKTCRDFLANRLPRIEQAAGVKVNLTLHDVMETDEYEALMKVLSERGLSAEAFPVLFVGTAVLFGSPSIDAELEDVLKSAGAEAAGSAGPVGTTPSGADGAAGGEPAGSADGSGSAGAKPLILVPVLLAGLIDGVNPCAFTTLIFLIAAMTLAGKRRREVAIIGLCFTVSVFISYALIGVGLFAVIRRAEAVPIVSKILRFVLAAFLVVVAALSVVDYVRVKRGKGEKMFLQLPKAMKRAIHKSIRGTLRSTAIAGSSIVLGFLVTIFELGCTGQIYLPTIAYMVRTGSGGASGWVSLLVYNIGFIVPLAGVFVVAYAGIGSEKIGDFFKQRLGSVKLATAVLFLGLAVLTLVIP